MFEFDANAPGKRRLQPLAKNALRKLRTVRHPDVLKFLDAVETENTIHVMTERVRPLGAVLQDWSAKGAQEKEDWLLWGVHRISVCATIEVVRRVTNKANRLHWLLSMTLQHPHMAISACTPSLYLHPANGN